MRDAVAERALEPAQQRLVEAFAVGQQHHHRDDAPRDAEHRQAGAHAVAQPARRRPRGARRHARPHDSNLSASTGGSCAARRAGYVDVTTPITHQQRHGGQARPPGEHHALEPRRHRQLVHAAAQRQRHGEPDRAAEHRQEEALEEELPLHLAGGGAERLAHADLARPLAHGHQHDVHHAEPAERQRHDADDAEEPASCARSSGRTSASASVVSHIATALRSVGIEAVPRRQDAPDLAARAASRCPRCGRCGCRARRQLRPPPTAAATMIRFDTTPARASVRGKSRAIAENGTNTLSLSGPL